MKVTLDLDQLLKDEKITPVEYDRLKEMATQATGDLAFNILIAFGVVAVTAGSVALFPSATTAVVLGILLLAGGTLSIQRQWARWMILAQTCTLMGVLLVGAAIIDLYPESLGALVAVTALLALFSLVARSGLLVVLATLALSVTICARSGEPHQHALAMQEPTTTVILFSIVAIGLYQLSSRVPKDYGRLAILSARTSVFLVNAGFWVGSIWGERSGGTGSPWRGHVIIDERVFSMTWAIVIFTVAAWAWRRNLRWTVNTMAIFGGIHLFTQWFEYFDATPGTLLVGGLFALFIGMGLKKLNSRMIKMS
ncbi:MAG: hypothetical protein HOI29_11195 [Planctomycetes bacterium]|jgi:iron complex transport system permease protein|nr:hypothetical protein [Planctomycetota bacterium]